MEFRIPKDKSCLFINLREALRVPEKTASYISSSESQISADVADLQPQPMEASHSGDTDMVTDVPPRETLPAKLEDPYTARDTEPAGKRQKKPLPSAWPGQIVVTDFGAFLGKKSERLQIRKGKEVLQEIPFHKVNSIVVAGSGVTISTDAIQQCVEHGIQIDFLTFSGKPYAKLTSPHLSATVITRREQLAAYQDKRGVKLAKAFALGKLRNQQGLLHYFARYRKSSDPEVFDKLSRLEQKITEITGELDTLDGDKVDAIREQLLSIEGRAGVVYWEGVRLLLGDKVEFKTREHRGTEDPFNSLLNYGYGMLYSVVWGTVVLAGLEPFAGFIHTDRPGKPSLCLDLVEEFRQRVVDRPVISLVTKGASIHMQDGMLADQTQRKLITDIQERLEARELYRGKKHTLRTIIQLQARRVASFMRGESGYKPFIGRW